MVSIIKPFCLIVIMKNKRTWIEIDSTSFHHNASLYKKIIGNNTLAIVIKANAYGHGMYQIAQLADDTTTITMICVATVSDAIALRNSGIQKPILILSTIFDEDPVYLIGQNIACSVYDWQTIEAVHRLGKKHNFQFPIHLKIDTGLSRLGVDIDDAFHIVQKILQLSHIKLQGIYSHFIESHKQDQSFTLQQVTRFAAFVQQLKANDIDIPFIHLANSAGTSALDLPFCNLFRVGVGIYGFWPSDENKKITQAKYADFELKPIATWKTHIMNIKQVKKGNYIGYDRAFQAPHDMRIAILPIGYFDGYDFRLFNKASVIVRNQHAPIIGRISMNMCTIDITAIASAALHDEVILMGPYPQVHPAELGHLAGNPNVREITTKINATIERVIMPSPATPDVREKKKYTISFPE